MTAGQSQRTKGAPRGPHRAARVASRDNLIVAVGVGVALVLFVLQARALWFTQDDAYISYRYAHNALAGYGLVFNPWEHVEGYTNFLWVVWLILAGLLGVGFDLAAKVLGLVSAGGMIVLTALLSRAVWASVFPGSRFAHWAGVFGALLLAGNGSLAYWSVSGLETAFFGMWVSLALWWWLRRSPLVIVALTLGILTRPEGGLIWLVLVVGEWWLGDGIKRAVQLFATVALLLIPFAVFKLAYYGSLLPNPFYAKTGLAWEYFASGLRYAWFFLQQYGLWGVCLALVLLAVFVLRGRWRIVPVMWLIFTLYIVAVGGDVLRPHRFFAPVLVLLVVSVLGALAQISARLLHRAYSLWLLVPVVAVWGGLGWWMPREILLSTRALEMGLVMKMTTVAGRLRGVDTTPFSLAASTIGKIAYDLPGHRVIDMLGLTDSTVARHPESIPGNVSSWRERNFNASYVLAQDPDYILFSTGHKPSAPAERALVLHEKFRRNYYPIPFPIPGRVLAVHKRKGEYTGADSVWPSIELAQGVNAAFNFLVRNQYDSAVAAMRDVKRRGPQDYALPDAFMAEWYMDTGQRGLALAHADSALAVDSFLIGAWRVRSNLLKELGDTVGAADAKGHIKRLAPWLVL